MSNQVTLPTADASELPAELAVPLKDRNFALTPVPENERRSWTSITLIMMAIGMDLSGLFLGLALANGLTFHSAIVVVLLGSTMLGLLGIICSIVGARTGLSSAMISSMAFGHEGTRVIALVMGMSLLGWFSVQAGFLGQNLATAFDLFHISIPTQIFSGLGGLLLTWTALYGYRAMERLAKWSVPLMIILVGSALTVQFFQHGVLVERPILKQMPFLPAISFVVGSFIAAISGFPDLSRYARTTKDAVLGAFLGIFIGNSLMLVIAVVLAKFTGEANLVRLFDSLHMGLFSVVVMLLAQWTTNTSNLYSASLSFAVFGRGLPISHRTYTICIGLVGTLLAVMGIADAFLGFLLVLSIPIAPVGGAYCGRYYVVLQRKVPQTLPRFTPSALLAWACGTVLSLMTTPHNPSEDLYGLGWFSITTIPALDGFMIAFVLAAVPALWRGRSIQSAQV